MSETSPPAAEISPAAQVEADAAEHPEAKPLARDFERPLSYADLRRLLGLVTVALGLFWLVREIGETLLLFVVVFLLAMVLNPLVNGLQKRRVPRGLAVVLVLASLLGVVIGAGALVVPPMLHEVNGLAERAPEYWQSIQKQAQGLEQRYPALDRFLPELDKLGQNGTLDSAKIGTYISRALTYTFGVLGALFGGIVALLLLVFTLLNPRPLVAGALAAVPAIHRDASERVLARFQEQAWAWARATIINGLITGVSTGLLLHFVGVQPALVFGVLAFFGEFVPNIGPLVAAVPALFVALGIGPTKFAMALGAILFVQQVESNLLVPFVMGRSMELHPVTIVFFALAMGSLLGITGAILAVPAAALMKILWDEFYLRPQQLDRDALDARADKLVRGETKA